MVHDNKRHVDPRLRPIAASDLDILLSWRNSDRIRSVMFSDHIISRDEHRSWFENITKSDSSIFLVFEYEQRPAGLVYFTNIDRMNGKCFWGFYLGDETLPAGTGIKLGILGLDYAFDHLGMRKVSGETFVFNAAGVNFHKKLGFVEEGRLARHILKNGKFEDVILFSLFKEEWDRRRHDLRTPRAR
jgi:UDP-4-amino-4,6-dideoxy-N-acetyl-beta-L-altrosamine N-acetyltransferase